MRIARVVWNCLAQFRLMPSTSRGNVNMALLPLMPIKRTCMNELIAIPKIAQWQKLKMLVLDSVSSAITKRVYNMALDEYYGWFQQSSRPGFTKATVSARRASLEERSEE